MDSLKPQPSLAIVKVRQGIVEIATRGACIVLAFIVFICAAVVSSSTSFSNAPNVTDSVNDARDLTHGGAGYIIFILFVTMIWEGIVIALRFLNLPIVNKYIGFLLIADILLHFLFNLHWFGSTIGFLVSGTVIWPAFRRDTANDDLGVTVKWNTIESASVATGVFSLFSIPVHIFLMVWTATWLFSKWQRNIDRGLRGGPTESDTADLDPNQQDID